MSLTAVVIDSSVAYKWFCSDGESAVREALDLLREHAAGELLLVAPAHMPAEVVNGLRYSSLDRATLRSAAEGLAGAEVALFGLDEALLVSAVDLALAHDVTVHDALFAALAVRLGCDLVTADRVQARIAECPVRLLV